jgi:hypothetical protein
MASGGNPGIRDGPDTRQLAQKQLQHPKRQLRRSSPPPGAATVAIRDSQDPHGPALTFTATDWQAFLRHVKGFRAGD